MGPQRVRHDLVTTPPQLEEKREDLQSLQREGGPADASRGTREHISEPLSHPDCAHFLRQCWGTNALPIPEPKEKILLLPVVKDKSGLLFSIYLQPAVLQNKIKMIFQ